MISDAIQIRALDYFKDNVVVFTAYLPNVAKSEPKSSASNPTPTRASLGSINTQLLKTPTPTPIKNLKASVMAEENGGSPCLGSIRPSPAFVGLSNGSLSRSRVLVKNEPHVDGGFLQHGMHPSTRANTANPNIQILIISQPIIRTCFHNSKMLLGM